VHAVGKHGSRTCPMKQCQLGANFLSMVSFTVFAWQPYSESELNRDDEFLRTVGVSALSSSMLAVCEQTSSLSSGNR